MITATFFPKTHLGKWSVGLFILFILLSAAANIFKPPLFSVIVYFHFAAAIGASITGILTVIKKGERSIFVYIAIPLGLLYASGLIIMGVGLIIQMF